MYIGLLYPVSLLSISILISTYFFSNLLAITEDDYLTLNCQNATIRYPTAWDSNAVECSISPTKGDDVKIILKVQDIDPEQTLEDVINAQIQHYKSDSTDFHLINSTLYNSSIMNAYEILFTLPLNDSFYQKRLQRKPVSISSLTYIPS